MLAAPVTGTPAAAARSMGACAWNVRQPSAPRARLASALLGASSFRASLLHPAGAEAAPPARQRLAFALGEIICHAKSRDERAFAAAEHAFISRRQSLFDRKFSAPGIEFFRVEFKTLTAARLERRRDELRAALGGVCSKCGASRELQFDCISPRPGSHHNIGLKARLAFYFKQHQIQQNLQLLCVTCHKSKSRHEFSARRYAAGGHRRDRFPNSTLP